MKITMHVIRGRPVPGKYLKTCENCQEIYMGAIKTQRFCDKICGDNFRFTKEARSRKLAKYGLTEAEYEQILKEQGGVCRICKRPELRTRQGRSIRLAVDHNHQTGDRRGLLCTDCNRGLGMFQDDPDRLESAAKYLRSFRCA